MNIPESIKSLRYSDREPDQFTVGYIACALWSSLDNVDESGGEPLDRNYSPDDIACPTLDRMVADCRTFQDEQREALTLTGRDSSKLGHCFWLNRNGHGSGFWDEGDEPCFETLSEASNRFGSFDLYIGDDSLIHGA